MYLKVVFGSGSLSNKPFKICLIIFQSGCLCLDLNETSRYMLVGGSDGLISVWDVKSKKIRKTYKVRIISLDAVNDWFCTFILHVMKLIDNGIRGNFSLILG